MRLAAVVPTPVLAKSKSGTRLNSNGEEVAVAAQSSLVGNVSEPEANNEVLLTASNNAATSEIRFFLSV
jgi:hypothetical protein